MKPSDHHGEYLKGLFHQYKPNITALSKKLGVDRQTVYNYFDYPKIAVETLLKIAEFLGHDIHADLPDLPIPKKWILEDQESPYYSKLTINECLKENSELHKELFRTQKMLNDVLEKYTALLKEKEVKNGHHPSHKTPHEKE